eukprot:CAMPEP_0174958072 /NCGR_PEP_ID=MMETSP0004_2-20121128/2425_1 /TAXON_ID=420556 /ORGANISM="Ochromonas sp., Strain CCMP1393" /LENGTH=403 /DNA_ID=CAMNT_0016206253 /DNA_START=86 /DNA_END=1300 /DNA_ORIENTATION=-
MARANLNIQTQVTEAFLQAQDSKDVRIIKVKIENEDLTLDGVINSIGTEQEDFESLLVTSLEDTQASFALFNLSTGAAENGSLKWLMVAWVPDGCRVRDKMLYSSSREDLKRSLGLGYFSAEYAANQRSDLTWNQFQDSLQKHHTPDIYTESERLVREEKVQVQAESSTSKSNALGVLPFKFSSGLEEQLVAFNSSTSATNWVEMRLENEVVEAVSNRVVAADERFQPFVDTQNVSFLAVKLPHSAAAAAAAAGEEEGGQHTGSMTLFVFSVPEEAPVRSKMAMSSCKATVIALAAQKHAVTFDKVLEVCSDADTIAQEVEHAIRAEISPLPHPPTAGGGGGGGADIGTAIAGVSSATASIAHRKPQRPGRGRAKVSKFKVEETAEIPAVGTAAGGAAVPADS